MKSLAIAFVLGLPVGVVGTARAVVPAVEGPSAQEQGKAQVYDEAADTRADIAAAVARARKENKRVLVQWGANWCVWCIRLHDLYQSDARIARELQYEYEVVYADIGKWDKNLDLAAELKADFKSHGVPYLTVLDAAGEPIVQQDTGALEVQGEPRHDPAKVLAFLIEHQAPYLDARELLKSGLADARAQGKRVFLHFGAPWCIWCHRLEGWLGQEEVAAVLGQDFVDLKIDQDRTIGGKELLDELRHGRGGGVPWFAFLDADGTELAASDDVDSGGDNVGFPQENAEVAWFGKAVAAARTHITDAQIETLKASLVKAREAREKAEREAKARQGAQH